MIRLHIPLLYLSQVVIDFLINWIQRKFFPEIITILLSCLSCPMPYSPVNYYEHRSAPTYVIHRKVKHRHIWTRFRDCTRDRNLTIVYYCRNVTLCDLSVYNIIDSGLNRVFPGS